MELVNIKFAYEKKTFKDLGDFGILKKNKVDTFIVVIFLIATSIGLSYGNVFSPNVVKSVKQCNYQQYSGTLKVKVDLFF